MQNKPFLTIAIPKPLIKHFYEQSLSETECWRNRLAEWREAKIKDPDDYLMETFGLIKDKHGNLCREVLPLGEFEVECNKLIVSDPSYERGTWCQGELEDVKEGSWRAYAEYVEFPFEHDGEKHKDKRVEMLYALHDSVENGDERPMETDNLYGWQPCDFGIGVDSGQAGIFDATHFGKDESVRGVGRINEGDPICEDEPFYSMCCDRTLSSRQAGILPYGCVSSSGLGDGSYNVGKQVSKKGEVVGVMISFL